MRPGDRALQQEELSPNKKPTDRNWRIAPTCSNWRKPSHSNKTQQGHKWMSKYNFKKFLKNQSMQILQILAKYNLMYIEIQKTWKGI